MTVDSELVDRHYDIGKSHFREPEKQKKNPTIAAAALVNPVPKF